MNKILALTFSVIVAFYAGQSFAANSSKSKDQLSCKSPKIGRHDNSKQKSTYVAAKSALGKKVR